MADRQINCVVCTQGFLFSDDEQAFYTERGFQDPKKCKPCRQNSKSQHQNFSQKRYFEATCSACGVAAQLPFVPKGDKPVFCRECFQDVNAPAAR